MSQTPETRFKEKVYKRLDEEFPRSFVYKNTGAGVRGLPDVNMTEEGLAIFLELKVEEGKEGEGFPLQLHRIRRIKEARGFGAVVYPHTLEDVIMEIKKHVRSITGKHYR